VDAEKDQVGLLGGETQGLTARGGLLGLQPCLAQHLGDGVAACFILIDGEDGKAMLSRRLGHAQAPLLSHFLVAGNCPHRLHR
jgi:hypothetical protein